MKCLFEKNGVVDVVCVGDGWCGMCWVVVVEGVVDEFWMWIGGGGDWLSVCVGVEGDDGGGGGDGGRDARRGGRRGGEEEMNWWGRVRLVEDGDGEDDEDDVGGGGEIG